MDSAFASSLLRWLAGGSGGGADDQLILQGVGRDLGPPVSSGCAEASERVGRTPSQEAAPLILGTFNRRTAEDRKGVR